MKKTYITKYDAGSLSLFLFLIILLYINIKIYENYFNIIAILQHLVKCKVIFYACFHIYIQPHTYASTCACACACVHEELFTSSFLQRWQNTALTQLFSTRPYSKYGHICVTLKHIPSVLRPLYAASASNQNYESIEITTATSSTCSYVKYENMSK